MSGLPLLILSAIALAVLSFVAGVLCEKHRNRIRRQKAEDYNRRVMARAAGKMAGILAIHERMIAGYQGKN